LVDVRNVYTGRYQHHIVCLMDGLIKTRCLLTGDSSFKANDDDYKVLTDLWIRMLIQWGLPVNWVERTKTNDDLYKHYTKKKDEPSESPDKEK